MRAFIFFLISFTIHCVLSSQVLNWSSAVRTGSAPNYTYTGTGIKAVITSNAVTLGDGTPRVDNTSGNGACYSGLAVYAGFFNSYLAAANSHITTTFSFAAGFGCTDVTIIIRDINSGESFTDFCDVLELSATYDNLGTALPTASIVTTLASNINRSNSGTTVKLVGHNSSAETTTSGPYTSGTSCGNSTVRFVPPAGMPLKTFTIKYRPARGTGTTNAYYTVNPRPAAQYVSFGNLSFTATSSCSQLLPMELNLFKAARFENMVNLNWQTASEKNNDYFTVERSIDGITFEEVKRLKGAGNSSTIKNYNTDDENPINETSYYRLKQTDLNGQSQYSDIISVDADFSKAKMSSLFPNPTSSIMSFDFFTPIIGELNYEIIDLTGRILISKNEMMEIGNSKVMIQLEELPKGIYFLKVSFDKTNLNSIHKLIKN